MPDHPATDSRADTVVDLTERIEDDTVYVIQSCYHYRDVDNYPKVEEELQVDEGWFASRFAADLRCEYLNARNRSGYNNAVAAQKRAHDAKIAKAELANREAAAIRSAGMNKPDVPVPAPFVAQSFERYLSESSYTSYESIAIKHSDHDGLARAAGVIPEQAA